MWQLIDENHYYVRKYSYDEVSSFLTLRRPSLRLEVNIGAGITPFVIDQNIILGKNENVADISHSNTEQKSINTIEIKQNRKVVAVKR